MGSKTEWTTIRVTKTLKDKLENKLKAQTQFQSVSSYASHILNNEVEKND